MKLFLYLMLTSFLFSQQLIETRQFTIYKDININSIDFSNYISNMSGQYILRISNISSYETQNVKKTILDQCDLKLTLSNYRENKDDKKVIIKTYDGIEAKVCDNVFDSSSHLKINKDNPIVTIHRNNNSPFTCEFIFWITGVFQDNLNKINKNNHGYLREWHENEQLYIEYKYSKGKKNGPQKRWFSNGQQEILYYYKNGKINGVQMSWYENGTLKSKWNYLNDNQHGKSEEWFSNGQVKYVKLFDNGILINILESYDSEGNIN